MVPLLRWTVTRATVSRARSPVRENNANRPQCLGIDTLVCRATVFNTMYPYVVQMETLIQTRVWPSKFFSTCLLH